MAKAAFNERIIGYFYRRKADKETHKSTYMEHSTLRSRDMDFEESRNSEPGDI